MSQISTRAICTINEGKLEEFKSVAANCQAIVAEKDTGTLRYDWFMNADQSVCVVLETYENSDAVMAHKGNLGDALGALLAVCDLGLEVYGSPSPALTEALSGFPHTLYTAL